MSDNLISCIILRCFDKNGIGTIARQELHSIFEVSVFKKLGRKILHCFDLQNLGEHLEEEEIEGLLDEADEGEGIIIYSEFCDIKNLN